MKTNQRIIALLFTIILGSATAIAQPPFHAPPDEDRPPPGEGRKGHEMFSPVRRLLMNLRENDAAEFERLQQLRVSDPVAFRAEIHAHMQLNFMERLKKTRPSVHEALLQMTEEDRTWIAQRIGRIDGPPPQEDLDVPPPPQSKDANEVRRLVRDYRRETDPDQQAELREKLRKELQHHYDQRIKARQAQLEDIRAKIVELELALSEGEQQREAFLSEKLEALLGPVIER